MLCRQFINCIIITVSIIDTRIFFINIYKNILINFNNKLEKYSNNIKL